ncbi:MAG: carboxy terminal-processing peptidase, partial [Lentisphaerae bacterium]|nr:carboxy terminal-processing peptidase [Lentisphaerota bacterium]
EKRLQVGDRIVAVAQGDEEAVDVLHWPLQRVVGLIRGKKKTKVVLTVIPSSDPTGGSTKKVDLIRDTVKLEDRAARSEIRTFNAKGRAYRLGVVSLPSFYANLQAQSRFSPDYRSATRDVARIITEMKEQNIDGMILDLRSNGGGYLPEAVSMTGLFISAGPVVKVVERGNTRVHRDTDFSRTYGGPMVVLLNRLSASATEILAGALQDYGRAVIVGDSRSHGKGTVQAPGPLADNAGLGTLKITVASYYRISGASTQLRGVVPDIVVPSPFDRSDYGEERFDNAIPWSSIEPEMYTRMETLRPMIPQLRAKSMTRRKNNERFASYLELLDRIESLSKIEEMPLHIDERRTLTEQEEELAELQRSILAELPGATEAEDKERADPVLDEALTIIADLITLRATETAKRSGKPGIVKKILGWFMH